MALIGTLVDDFRSATLNTALWNATNSAGNNGVQAGGRYTFIVQAGATGDATLASDTPYDLTGSHIHVELINAGIQEAGLETYPLILTQNPANLTDSLFVVISNGTVGIYKSVAGVQTGLAFPSYDAVAMRWWRIRESGGAIYFETAPTVGGTWTVHASTATPITITSLYAVIRTFDFLALSTAKSTAISNVNHVGAPDVDFPNGALPVGVELAFGADPASDQGTWTWTQVSPPGDDSEVWSDTIAVSRGRQNESSHVTPTQADAQLDNETGDLTPDNPNSIYYPDVVQGTPGRLWLEPPDITRLWLRDEVGSRASAPHVTAFDVTGDIDVRIDLQLGPKDASASGVVLVGPYDYAADQRGWRIDVMADNRIQFSWSTDGTLANTTIVTSDTPVLPTNTRTVLRVTLDVNNGSGGWTLNFYLGESITGPWTQAASTETGTPTTSIFAANAPLEVGNETNQAALATPRADVYRLQVRSGINGTVKVDADFSAEPSGTTTFVDSTGILWNIEGSAMLTDRWYRVVGTVDSWEPEWPWGDLSSQIPGGVDGGEARINITLAGILRRLGQGASPLDSPLRRAITDEPTLQAYWPMEDLRESDQIASALPGGLPMLASGVTFETDDTLLGSKPLPELTDAASLAWTVNGTFTGEWQVDWYVHWESAPSGSVAFMRVTTNGTGATWIVDTDGVNVGVTVKNSSGTTISSNGSLASSLYGGWVHIRLFAAQNGSNVDWTLVWFPVTYPTTSGFFFTGSFAGSVGAVLGGGIQPDADLGGLRMGHLAVMAASDLDTVDNAATGWLGDTAVARMARLCREEGIEFRVFGSSSDSALVGVQRVATLLDLLNDAADADAGVLYEMPDAVGLIYRTRTSMYNQPPNMILDAHAEEIQNPFRPILDDQRLHNDVTVTRTGGSSVNVTDETSITKHGRYDDAVTLNLYSDSQLSDAAGWRLHQGVVPGMRYPQLTTDLGLAPQVIPEWLTVDTGARVHVTNLPPQHPNATVRVITEGYREPFSATTWNPTANCSPASVWDVGELYGDWVDDQYLLRLETDGSVLADAIDADDVALFVSVTAGPYWVTGAGEFPFDLAIGGEQVTVTGIGAPSGGSEFTGAADYEDATPTASFVAPSVPAPAIGDLLICTWCSYQFTGTYTLPAGMTIAARTDGTYTSLEDATRTLTASGATGAKTATFSSSDTWSALSVVVHSALGTPTVVEYLNSSSTAPAEDITITTILSAEDGDWLLAIQGWDWDPGDNMTGPTGDGWTLIADSINASADTSRVQVWAKRVTAVGTQSVIFPVVGGINDNHARLYLLRGVTGITQQFTVTRSVNGVARSHAMGTAIELWNQPVLAR